LAATTEIHIKAKKYTRRKKASTKMA